MTYKLSRRADTDLLDIEEYISQDNPAAAEEVLGRIYAGIEQLVQFPRSARPGLVEGTRELVITPYRITYKIDGDLIYIVSVIHGKRER